MLDVNTPRKADPAKPGESLPVELRGDVFELLLILARARTRIYEPRNEQGQQGALNKALATLNRADEWRPGSPALYLRRADIYERLGNQQAALVDQQRAETAKPETALDHYLLGHRGGTTDAFTHYIAALRVEPDHAPSFFSLGQHYRYHHHPEQAELCYTACMALLPDESMAYRFRGLLYLELTGEPAKAAADFTTALQLEADRWDVLEFRGIAYDRMGRHQQAINDYTAAYELVPDNMIRAEFCFHRGHAYLGLNQFSEALAGGKRFYLYEPDWRRF